MRQKSLAVVFLLVLACWRPSAAAPFVGKYFRGEGDTAYLQLLDISRRMFGPDPEFQNVAMLYTPAWNGFVEGPTWNAWWIQNSYGPSYCAAPFLGEPLRTFLQNAQDLWFDQMGDGKRQGAKEKDWIGPDGCLCDAASPGWIVYKQGDGRTDIHDWGLEFTAAGIVLQAELLLVERDQRAIQHYLPLLERSANFIETRRAENNLFLAGPAGNLLAPSYAGWRKADGSFDKAYLAGLSITYLAALDRLIELERMLDRQEKVDFYSERRESARQALPLLMTEEGYFIKSLDPDGTRHGVHGAPQHGYFEASPNHDAIAFRIVDDRQARRIYDKIASIPLLRRNDLICANEPGLDDMYDPGTSWLWRHGTWVNGGHWSTCEARMVLAYYRLGEFDDARRSMEAILRFARQFRLDNPLVDFGAQVYQPKEPINLCYDTFGPPAAMVRGLFEYLYDAEGLTLRPHIPASITRLEQHFPIHIGGKTLYLATAGSGPVSAVTVNGQPWKDFDVSAVRLPYAKLPERATIFIGLGNASIGEGTSFEPQEDDFVLPPPGDSLWSFTPPGAAEKPVVPIEQIRAFCQALRAAGLSHTYEARHARLIIEQLATVRRRQQLLADGALAALPEASQAAADKSYWATYLKLVEGLVRSVQSYADSDQDERRVIYRLWNAARPD